LQFSASASSHTCSVHTGQQRQVYIGPKHTVTVWQLGPIGSW